MFVPIAFFVGMLVVVLYLGVGLGLAMATTSEDGYMIAAVVLFWPILLPARIAWYLYDRWARGAVQRAGDRLEHGKERPSGP